MAERPFCFIVVVWGERYRNGFLDYALPSLLSPRNIPAVRANRPVRFLFATTKEDWQAIRRTAIFATLERWAEPVFFELPPPTPERPIWLHAILGHQLLCDAVYREKGYRILTCPDSLASDGMFARVDELARQGAQVVLSTTTRLGTETLFKTFAEDGLLPERSAQETGAPLVLTSRQVASAFMRSMHSQMVVNEWDAPYYLGQAAAPWWRVPGEDGLVLHALFWDLLLLDYAAIETHDSAILAERGFDGDYFFKNFGHLDSIYTIRDSDEGCHAPWTPLDFDPAPLRRFPGELGKRLMFRGSFYGPRYNDMHRKLFFMPHFLHAKPLNNAWDAVEDRAMRTLLRWVDPPPPLAPLAHSLPGVAREYAALDARIERSRPVLAQDHPTLWRWRQRLVALASGCVLALLAARMRLLQWKGRRLP